MISAKNRGWKVSLFLFIGCICSLLSSITSGQKISYTLKRYTTEHGLPNNQVKYITKDTCGFLWIATFDGLSRFDGYEFRNYYHDPNDTTSIPSFNLLKVLVDKNNSIWVFGPGAICRFNRSNESFKHYALGTTDQIRSKKIFGINLDRDSTLWIIGDAGFDKFDAPTGKFIQFHHPASESQPTRLEMMRCCDLIFDEENNFWLIDESGSLYTGFIDSTIFPGSYKIQDIFHKPPTSNEGNFEFQANLFKDVDGEIWIASNEGLFRFDRKQSAFIKTREHNLIGTKRFKQPVTWSEMDLGAYIYYPDVDSVFTITSPSFHFEKGNFFDHNVFWFGGQAKNAEGIGLVKVLFTQGQFKHILIPGDETGTKTAIFGLIKDSRGILWAGIRGKPYLLRISPDGSTNRYYYSAQNYLKNGNHLRTLVMVDKKIWAGYLFNYCYWYDPSETPIEHRTIDPDHILSDYPLSDQSSFRLIYQTDQQHVIIGGKNTLIYFSLNDHKIVTTFPSTGQLFCIFQDRDSIIWIGATDTLYKFGKGLTHIEKLVISHGNYNIESIVEGDSATLWLAMMGGGVARFNKENRTIKVFGTKDGLSNNYLYEMLKDHQGNLWISTNKGISMFNTTTYRFRNFGIEDGLTIEEFNADAAYQTPEGEMIFGGMGGIITFYPDSVLGANSLTSKLPLLLTSLTAAGDSIVTISDIYERKRVLFPKGTKHLAISFACIDFRNAEKILYRYRISEISPQWIVTDSRHRYIRFTGLKPGDYTFELQATDINGNWTNSKNLKFQIPSYLYQKVWFQISIISLIILVIGILFWMWRRQIKLKEQHKTIQFRLDSLRNQLNPHFLFNSLNSINYFISTHDQLSANQYITGFSRLMRAILTNSSTEYISMEKELEAIEDYCKLEHLRFGDKFDYNIEVDEQIDPAEIEIASTMIQPFIENAIWHGVRCLEGRKGHINIEYKPGSSDHIICTITDDGIGRKASVERKSDEQRKHRSRGMAIIKERLEMINDIRRLNLGITVEDLYPGKEEAGTRVTIEIPIKTPST